jgi:cytidine deaminase
LFSWGANHPDDPIEAMAVTAHSDDFPIVKPITSCGSCLQVLAECEKQQNQSIKIILHAEDGPIWIIKGIENQLPFLFFEERIATQ